MAKNAIFLFLVTLTFKVMDQTHLPFEFSANLFSGS